MVRDRGSQVQILSPRPINARASNTALAGTKMGYTLSHAAAHLAHASAQRLQGGRWSCMRSRTSSARSLFMESRCNDFRRTIAADQWATTSAEIRTSTRSRRWQRSALGGRANGQSLWQLFIPARGGHVHLPVVAELKRRRVFRAVVAYGAAAFALLQIIEPITPALHLPDATLTSIVVALALAFPVVLVGGFLAAVRREVSHSIWPKRRRAVKLMDPATAVASIAVLPFVDMSPAKDQEYFSDGCDGARVHTPLDDRFLALIEHSARSDNSLPQDSTRHEDVRQCCLEMIEAVPPRRDRWNACLRTVLRLATLMAKPA